MALADELEILTQQTGATPDLTTQEGRDRFGKWVRTDIAAIINQLNNVYHPLVDALVQVVGLDALDEGINGRVIYTDNEASAGSGNTYWSTASGRARTIKESFDVILSELATLQNSIASSTPDDLSDEILELESDILAATQNLTQLKLDTMGPTYTLDNDGAADMTYPLSQHVDALGAFFTGFPGTGNSPYTSAYPALSFTVNLSDVNIDTTLAQATITDLPAHLAAIRTFTGMDTATATTTYSAHGALSTVSDGDSLELAIWKLDSAIVGAAGGAFLTAANVTSNSPGTVATDDFVFGSAQLDDTGSSSHDNRMLFDKSKGAFRAGGVTGTEWDNANRGDYSVAFGNETTAAGEYSFVSGLACNVTSSSTMGSSILGGEGNTMTEAESGVIAGGSGNTIGNIGNANRFNGILAGEDNSITGTSTWCSILGGRQNSISSSSQSTIIGGFGNDIANTGVNSAILGGDGHAVEQCLDSVILGGQSNSIMDGSYGAIVGGDLHMVSTGAGNYNIVIGGSSNTVDTGVSHTVLLNATNTTVTASNCVVSGSDASTDMPNSHIQSAGTFPGDGTALTGQAQVARLVLMREVSGAGFHTLTMDGAAAATTNVLYIPAHTAVHVIARWVIVYADAGDTAATAGTTSAVIHRHDAAADVIYVHHEFTSTTPTADQITMTTSGAGGTGTTELAKFIASALGDGYVEFQVDLSTGATTSRAVASIEWIQARADVP